MRAIDPGAVAQAMAIDEVDGLDPEDRFKLSLQEKMAVHRAFHDGRIGGADLDFYMAVAKSRRRLVVYVENRGERVLADIEQLYDSARELGNLEAAFRRVFELKCAGHRIEGPFSCDFARAHWAEGPLG